MSVEKDSNTREIYVALLDEGIGVWKPVKAELVGEGQYRLQDVPDYDEDVEKWEFPPGSQVACEMKKTEDGEILAAVRLA